MGVAHTALARWPLPAVASSLGGKRRLRAASTGAPTPAPAMAPPTAAALALALAAALAPALAARASTTLLAGRLPLLAGRLPLHQEVGKPPASTRCVGLQVRGEAWLAAGAAPWRRQVGTWALAPALLDQRPLVGALASSWPLPRPRPRGAAIHSPTHPCLRPAAVT